MRGGQPGLAPAGTHTGTSPNANTCAEDHLLASVGSWTGAGTAMKSLNGSGGADGSMSGKGARAFAEIASIIADEVSVTAGAAGDYVSLNGAACVGSCAHPVLIAA